ncbi:chemotaxis protein CheW [Pseudomonas japonica]|uniref:Chemotaxis protein CheW n=1 Tax=Pseudomonas japonica TaxID=256466 RepID=A0A239IMQ6_9PSED|nr:chemotaxis protein CheW [Pseudomonas japonica]SNS94821.1 chemotaxis-related protein WspD [Pseudomonas japonica]
MIDGINMLTGDVEHIDDCWNRIGVHGDKSCPLLAEHVHCRNCAVYAAAATRLLDRYALAQDAHVRDTAEEQVEHGPSLLLFRLGEEWLALATRCLAEVAPLQPVHSLPHQRSRVLQGVANVRGALVPCLSLIDLLGLELTPAAVNSARVMPRMLILAAKGGAVVLPVDEVDGIHALDQHLHGEAGHENRFTRQVLQWRGRSVRILDEDQVLSAVDRSLS